MNDQVKPVNVTLLDKEYIVACHDSERESLYATAEMLSSRMKALRDGGKVIGSERIAVMAALNIAHEFLQYKNEKEGYTDSIGATLKRVEEKISRAISKGGTELETESR